MLTSLDQLFKHYNVSQEQKTQFETVCKPKQQDFVKVVPMKTGFFVRKLTVEKNLSGYFLRKITSNTFDVFERKESCVFTPEGQIVIEKNEPLRKQSPVAILIFNEQEYERRLKIYNVFWDWKRNRNKVRFEMEKEYSYDLKHAMHLVRLLRMGHEALTEGVIRVKRPDAKELLSIRAGAWTYEEVVQYAEHMNNEVEKAVQTTQLPKSVNMVRVANLVMNVQNMVW